jgi:cell pole-organizing protein PopZ
MGMQQWEEEEKLSMDEAVAAIRRVFAEEEADHKTPAADEPRASDGKSKRTAEPEAALLSRETTAAVSSAVSRLTQNIKKQSPTLEEMVREALRPALQSWVDENLPDLVERMVQSEIERVIRGR